MGNMSLKKLTGICFIVGVLANTLPFILTIFAGATPEEGVNIFQFFSGETIKYGTAGHAYSLISVIGLALVSFSVLMLREIMQGDGKDDNPLMRLGAYLFFVASIGFMVSWSLDNAMAWDSSGEVAKNFMKLLTPKDSKFIKIYRGNIPLFHSVGIEEKLNKIFEPVVHLPSGGYLVINPTEALISIDINSGKSTKETNIERTALVTNLEAAEEISRQIRMRNLSVLIVIDFIDMFNYHHKRMVERKLKEKMKSDRARIQLSKISNFGLLEMSRQRLGEGSVKWNMTLSLESFALKIVKILEEQAFLNKVKIINAIVPEKVKLYIEINLEKELLYYKKKYRFEINLISNKELIIPEYTIELLNKKKKLIKKVEYIEKIEKNLFDKRNIKTDYNRSGVFPNKILSNKLKNKKKYGYGKKFSPKKKTKKHLWVNRNAVQ